MVHGSLVTLEDMQGLGVATHIRGKYRKGFGKDAIDPAAIVGVWTHFVVNNYNNSGTRSLRDALSGNNRWITFDPALGSGTITLTSNMTFPINFHVSGIGVRCNIAGAFDILRSSSTPGRKGFTNIRFLNARSGGDMLNLAGINGTGRQYIFLGWNEFHNGGIETDDAIDISSSPTLGYYITEVGNWLGPETTGNWEIVHIFGNEVPTQNNHHNRMTNIRAAYYGGSANFTARDRFRMPELRDSHLEDMESYREWGKEGVILWNTTSTNRIKFRTRYSIWDRAKVQPAPDDAINRAIYNHASSLANAHSRVENAITMSGVADASFTLWEGNRDLVTDATIYVDESGVSISEYNDYTPGGDFVGMTNAEKRAYIRGWSRWFDRVTLGGTALTTATGGDLAGKTVTLTNSVDNWPALTDTQKVELLTSARGGTSWDAVVALMAAGDVSISGKTVTITFPAAANTIGFDTDEDIYFSIPHTLTTRSAFTEADDPLTITANAGDPDPPPDPDDVVVEFEAGYSNFVQENSTADPVFGYLDFPDDTENWVGASDDGFFRQRTMWEWDISTLPALAVVHTVRLKLNVVVVHFPTTETWDIHWWDAATQPSVMAAELGGEAQIYAQSGAGPVYANTGAYDTTGEHIIIITSTDMIDRIHEVIAGTSTIPDFIALSIKQANEDNLNHQIRFASWNTATPPILEVTYQLGEEPPPPTDPTTQVVIQVST